MTQSNLLERDDQGTLVFSSLHDKRQKHFIQEIFDRKWIFFRKNAKIRSKNSKFSMKNKFLAKMPAGTSDFFMDSGPHAKI